MRKTIPTLVAAGLFCSLGLSVGASATVRPHHHTATHAVVRHSLSTRGTHHAIVERAATPSMTPERATEIQTALIQRGYLTGGPTGTWDTASHDAMQKMQSDNGWQTKLVPDSRALIKLGLGPSNAADGSPQVSSTASVTPEAPSLNY